MSFLNKGQSETATGRDNITHITPANTNSGSVRTAIPQSVVSALKLGPNDTVKWTVNGNVATVTKSSSGPTQPEEKPGTTAPLQKPPFA